jgi:hypothetical protein
VSDGFWETVGYLAMFLLIVLAYVVLPWVLS